MQNDLTQAEKNMMALALVLFRDAMCGEDFDKVLSLCRLVEKLGIGDEWGKQCAIMPKIKITMLE
jgi:hypothetical protein